MATTLTKLQADLEAKYAKTSAAIVAWLGEVNAKFEAAVKEWETYPQVGGGVGGGGGVIGSGSYGFILVMVVVIVHRG